jgi:tetratricopeptide (TPR) repeat protein
MNFARNAPCSCGSGKRYKACCGALNTPRMAVSDAGAAHAGAAMALNDANRLARAGRLPEAQAAYEVILRSHDEFAEAHANLGELQVQQERFADAEASCRRALALKPEMAQAHRSLGNALARLHRVDESLASFARALAIDPNYLDAHMNAAAVQRSIGQLHAAAASLGRALEIDPDLIQAHIELATVYRLQRRTAECERSCAAALRSDPTSTAALAVLAELYADLGDFARAQALHRRILGIDAEALESVAALSRLKRMAITDSEWLEAAQRLLDRPWPVQRKRLLHFALGKYHDDVGEFDQAFHHYRLANELSRQLGPKHDAAALTRTVDVILRRFDPAWIANRHAAAPRSDRPVFVVGMLRSGTTLAEQILASHPDVFGAGELSFWSNHCAAAFAHAAASRTPLDVNDTEVARLGTDYLRVLASADPKAARVIDKFPANFFFMGLIHAALPGVRFIHMQRDPRDTCLSIYFQQFEAANAYAHDLQDLAHYHGQYRRLMRHWRAVLPSECLLEVPYEGLVEDPERWSRRMLEFVGLAWDARCLDFSSTPRAVVTASRWQVRQGILNSSVGRWRGYAAHLGPLADLKPDPALVAL